MFCTLCGEPCEEADQPENAALCNSCVAYLNAKFAPVAEVLADPDVEPCHGPQDTTCPSCGLGAKL